MRTGHVGATLPRDRCTGPHGRRSDHPAARSVLLARRTGHRGATRQGSGDHSRRVRAAEGRACRRGLADRRSVLARAVRTAH